MTLAIGRYHARMLAGLLPGIALSTLTPISHAAPLPVTPASPVGTHWLPRQIMVSESSEQFCSQWVEARRTGDHADAVGWWEAAAALGEGMPVNYQQAEW